MKNNIKNLEEIGKKLEPIRSLINESLKKIQPFIKLSQEMQQSIQQVLKSPKINLLLSFFKSGIFEHELLVNLFPDGFDKKILENNWSEIQISLKNRWPKSLLNNDRKKRLEQIYKAQDAGAYIAVCRAVYPEIECLLREEILFKDTEFLSEFHKKSEKQRSDFLNKNFSPIKKSPSKSFGVSDDTALNEINIFTGAFLWELEKCFKSYDPKNNLCENSKKEIKNNRHFHCHGWSQKAEFIDALYALLMLDMTMCLIDKLNNQQLQINHDQK